MTRSTPGASGRWKRRRDEAAQTLIGGVPDVILLNAARGHPYVAIGDPGAVEVIDTRTITRTQIVSTEAGAHTTGFDPVRKQPYVFCPQTRRAAVHEDTAL